LPQAGTGITGGDDNRTELHAEKEVFMPKIIVLAVVSGFLFSPAAQAAAVATGGGTAWHRGVYEVRLEPGDLSGNPFFDHRARVLFQRLDDSEVGVDAFYDGDGIWKARAYCDQIGVWNHDGTLYQGAHDFGRIYQFFRDAKLTLVGFRPDDALVGNQPLWFKCALNEDAIIVYLANPSGNRPETDNPGVTKPTVRIDVPEGAWNVRWFQLRTGQWIDGKPIEAGARKLTAPHDGRSTAGDWLLLLQRR
jgi:hypothetical protein